MQVHHGEGVGEARLAAILAGESPANRGGPVAVVVISSNGEGNRSVGSLEVKAPVGGTKNSLWWRARLKKKPRRMGLSSVKEVPVIGRGQGC